MKILSLATLLLVQSWMCQGMGLNIAGSALRTSPPTTDFIRKLEYRYTLRVCNAYPFTSALDVFLETHQVQLTQSPLIYKACEEFKIKLDSGDKLSFKVGKENIGTFTISDLPREDATLLLIIYRHDTESTAVSFQSHVFTRMSAPQIGVLDTYRGKSASSLHIEDLAMPGANSTPRDETLRFDSVVAIDSGAYRVSLRPDSSKANVTVRATTKLIALNNQAYIVMRVGVEAKEGPSYPEELVVFPRSDPALLGGSPRGGGVVGAFVVAVVMALSQVFL
mmetsp:Transcript_58257/g.123665  ORF Transcript_58257/g.123665 Transcript_58257/m.123665 type:complete len:279 (+) Transcript_58257:119-955(+)